MESSPGLGVALAFYNDSFFLCVIFLLYVQNERRATVAQTEKEISQAWVGSPPEKGAIFVSLFPVFWAESSKNQDVLA